MKYLKENYFKEMDNLRDHFNFSTKKVNTDIFYSSKKNKNINNISAMCTVNWSFDFNFYKGDGVEITPVMKTIDFTFFIDKFIEGSEETEEVEEIFTFECNYLNTKIILPKNEYESILFLPEYVDYDYDKKKALVYLKN